MRSTLREKGAVRPLWLCLGVLTVVTAGAVANKCLCNPSRDETHANVVVKGSLINQAPPQEQPKQQEPEPKPDERKPMVEEGAEPVVVKDSKLVKTPTEPAIEDPLGQDAPRLKPEEIKKGFAELTFDTLADWSYEFPEMTDGKPEREDPIPAKIKKMGGKKFAIRGFMIPFKVDGEEVTEFLLVRNQFACCFGVVPKMNEWLHIKMAQGKKAPYAVDVPITVYGTFTAAELIEKGVVMSLYRMEATEVEEPPIFR